MTSDLDQAILRFLDSGPLLDDGAATAASLERWGIPFGAPATHDERERLRRLRDLLRRIARSLSDTGEIDDDDLARLNAVIGRAPVRAQLERTEDGRYLVDMTPVGGNRLDRAERELAGAFTAMLRRSHPPRVKVCAECGRVFYDESRNRTRRWCDSRTCGNRARVRRYRASR